MPRQHKKIKYTNFKAWITPELKKKVESFLIACEPSTIDTELMVTLILYNLTHTNTMIKIIIKKKKNCSVFIPLPLPSLLHTPLKKKTPIQYKKHHHLDQFGSLFSAQHSIRTPP